MQFFLLKKAAVIGALIIVLMIALSMAEGVINERHYYRGEARDSIAKSWTGEQKIVGPVLVLPYLERVEWEYWDAAQKKKSRKIEYHPHKLYTLPENLNIEAQVRTELRYRGLYGVPVYTAQLQCRGTFEMAALNALRAGVKNVAQWDAPYLAVIVNDIRGIPSGPKLDWLGALQAFAAGSGIDNAPQGMHAMLPALPDVLEQNLPFSFSLDLRGMESLAFAPSGMNTHVGVQADWRHPSFIGSYLPEQREIAADGFAAQWRVSSFSSDIERQLRACQNGDCGALLGNGFGVAFLQPVDIYSLSERSVKYGILFVGVIFIAFLVFEIVKKHAIHPIQYLLVGLALAIFYLLLVSLSEHIAFVWAYWIAAGACTGLLGYYLTAVLRGIGPGLLFSLMAAAIYGALYIIINSEDSALLMGSGLLFLMLSVLMAATRRIDWYALSAGQNAGVKP